MGYRGKLAERQQARQLRRTGLPLADIAARLGVSRSSVSLWVGDVEFTAPVRPPPRGRRRGPNALQRRRRAEIDRLVEEGRVRIGRLTEREVLVAGVALYRGRVPRPTGASASPTATRA
jgi:transposase